LIRSLRTVAAGPRPVSAAALLSLLAVLIPELAAARDAVALARPAPVLALVHSSVRDAPRERRSSACVQGTVPPGTPVVLVEPRTGRRCAMTAAEVTRPISGTEPCTALDGECPGVHPRLAVIGVSAADVRAAAPVELAPPERDRAVAAAGRALRARELRATCSSEPLQVPAGPVRAVRPFGARSPLVLLEYRGRIADRQLSGGPVVVWADGTAEVLWSFSFTPRAFYVDGRAYLWSAEAGLGCGARTDTIYAVEGDRLRTVVRTAFLSTTER
jgi:hypothetical protein